MAGTISLQQLFLNKFLEVNLDRYADDPEMLPLFQGLTLAEIVISDLNPGVPEAQTATVSSASRNFRGVQQAWTPAFLNSVNAFTLMNKDTPLANLAELSEQTVPGVYGYTDGATVVPGLVLPSDTDSTTLEANAKAGFQSAYKYVIADSELTVGENDLSVTLNAYTRGSIVHVVAEVAVKVIPATDYGRLAYPEIAE